MHANFNKKGVLDLNVAHVKLIDVLINNDKCFDTNIYKQYKIIKNFDEHLLFQKEISDKYLWINYLKEKVIEIINVKVGLHPTDLEVLLHHMLEALYYDRIK